MSSQQYFNAEYFDSANSDMKVLKRRKGPSVSKAYQSSDEESMKDDSSSEVEELEISKTGKKKKVSNCLK